jgi:hypothetical protein
MVAAAYEVRSVDRNCDWLAELEQIVSRLEALPSAAQDAVRSVVESLLRDPETTALERVHAHALLAPEASRSCRCLAEQRHTWPCRFGGGTVWRVRVQASPEAVQLIEEQGGKLYVRAKRSRCCHGSLTFLETSSEPAGRSYRRVSADEIELYLDERLGDPEELVIEARGRRRKHVHAYWDGCIYVV